MRMLWRPMSGPGREHEWVITKQSATKFHFMGLWILVNPDPTLTTLNRFYTFFLVLCILRLLQAVYIYLMRLDNTAANVERR